MIRGNYLEAGGVIAKEGNQIRASRAALDSASGVDDEPAATTTNVTEPATVPATAIQGPAMDVRTAFTAAPTAGIVQFDVSVRVDMKEFSGWRPERIAAFFSGIAHVLTAKGAVEKGTSNE